MAKITSASYEVQCLDPPRLLFYSCLGCGYAGLHAICVIQIFGESGIKDDWIVIDGLDAIRFYGDIGRVGGLGVDWGILPGDPFNLRQPIRRIRRSAGSIAEWLDVLEREVTKTLMGHRLNGEVASAAGWHLRGQFADAVQRVGRQLPFPRQAPRLWVEARGRDQDPRFHGDDVRNVRCANTA